MLPLHHLNALIAFGGYNGKYHNTVSIFQLPQALCSPQRVSSASAELFSRQSVTSATAVLGSPVPSLSGMPSFSGSLERTALGYDAGPAANSTAGRQAAVPSGASPNSAAHVSSDDAQRTNGPVEVPAESPSQGFFSAALSAFTGSSTPPRQSTADAQPSVSATPQSRMQGHSGSGLSPRNSLADNSESSTRAAIVAREAASQELSLLRRQLSGAQTALANTVKVR